MHRWSGDGLVPVFVTTAVRTSASADPGARRVPPAEAAALIRNRHAAVDTSARYFRAGSAGKVWA